MGTAGRSTGRDHGRSVAADEQRTAIQRDVQDAFADPTRMLFSSADAAAYAMAKRLDAKPDSRWQYSSGTTNIISCILRHAVDDDTTYHALPRRSLFDRIGMRHAVMETDATGTFVGSSFSWASARIGPVLDCCFSMMESGRASVFSQRAGSTYCRRPTPAAPRGCYGAHWWCNAGTPNDPENRRMPRLPSDLSPRQRLSGPVRQHFPSSKAGRGSVGSFEPVGHVQPPRFSRRRFGVRRPLTLHPALNLQDMPACKRARRLAYVARGEILTLGFRRSTP